MTDAQEQRLAQIIDEVFSQVTPELLAWVNAQTFTDFQIPESMLDDGEGE